MTRLLVLLLLLVPQTLSAAGAELQCTQYALENDTDGDLTTGNETCIPGNILITHDLNIMNDLDVYQNAVVHGNQSTLGDAAVTGSLTVGNGFRLGGGGIIGGQVVLEGICSSGVSGGGPCETELDCPDGVDPRGGGYTTDATCDSPLVASLTSIGNIITQNELHAGGSSDALDGSARIIANPDYNESAVNGFGVFQAWGTGPGATSDAPLLEFYRATGSVTTPLRVTSGAQLGRVNYFGYDPDAGEYFNAAQIIVDATEAFAFPNYGTRMIFQVVPKGEGTLTAWLKSTNKAKAHAPRGLIVGKTATPTPSVTATAATPTPLTGTTASMTRVPTQTPTPTATSTISLKDTGIGIAQFDGIDVIGGITINNGSPVVAGLTATPVPSLTPYLTATPVPSLTPYLTATPVPSLTPYLTATPVASMTPVPTLTPPFNVTLLNADSARIGPSPTATATPTPTSVTPTATGATPTPTVTKTPDLILGNNVQIASDVQFKSAGSTHTIYVEARNNAQPDTLALQGGNPTGTASVTGGPVTITGGLGGVGGGVGGAVTITGGAAVNNAVGGSVTLAGGVPIGFQAAGSILLNGGAGWNGSHVDLNPAVGGGGAAVGAGTSYIGGNAVSRIAASGAAPTVGTCGTSPSIVGTNNAMKVTIGTGGTVSACTVTFGSPAFQNAPPCVCAYNTTTGAIGELLAATTTTTLIVTNEVASIATAFAASAVLNCLCFGRE